MILSSLFKPLQVSNPSLQLPPIIYAYKSVMTELSRYGGCDETSRIYNDAGAALNWVKHQWGRCVMCFDCGFLSGACRIIFFITLSSVNETTELPLGKNR